jgi:hypothetical protein
MTNERPEVDFSGKLTDITLNKDGTVTIKLKVNRYRGLVDELIEVQDRETDFHAVVAHFQPRLANEPIVPRRPVEGCAHMVEARRWHRGDEVCSECGTILGHCTHPEVVGVVGATEGTCSVCGEKVANPEAPAATEEDEPTTTTIRKRRGANIIPTIDADFKVLDPDAPVPEGPEDEARSHALVNGLKPFRQAVDALVEKGYSDEIARRMAMEDARAGLVAYPVD